MDTLQTSTPAALAVRPLGFEDLDAVAALDGTYAGRHGCAAVAEPAALRYYARSGHSFVADAGDETFGAVFAHAVWDGARPSLRVGRLMAAGDAPEVLERLVRAVVKSAYDAAVYDLVVDLPASDAAGRAAVETAGFRAASVARFERALGSRSSETR